MRESSNTAEEAGGQREKRGKFEISLFPSSILCSSSKNL
jgi:hypothetical protein